jgi:hypothetical protein
MMGANVEKAFDFAQESTKQILTLSTAILTLTITFQKDIVGAASAGDRWALTAAWISFLTSIVFGLATLLNLAGNLERPANDTPSIYRPSIVLFSVLQILAFSLGLLFTLWYGVVAF